MTIEGTGHMCPQCGEKTVLLYSSSSHALQYDACPTCGFAFGEAVRNDRMEEMPASEVWDCVVSHYGYILQADLSSLTMEEARAKIAESIKDQEPERDIFSVYDHRSTATHPEYKAAYSAFHASHSHTNRQ